MAQESWKLDQEETGCQPPEGPIYCANNCGFFGSIATMNMCSKCYRDVVLVQTVASSVKAASENLENTPSISGTVEIIDEVDGALQSEPVSAICVVLKSAKEIASPERVLQAASLDRPVNRCYSCNKRLGLTNFKCRCGDIFCSLHRYSDKHDCNFDYKSAGRDAICKANPVVKADKVEKI